MPGIAISEPEITNISQHGFWLLLEDEELFLPFALFPWFRGATIEQITTVEMPAPEHLYWPLLDVDLCPDAVRSPEKYPLTAK